MTSCGKVEGLPLLCFIGSLCKRVIMRACTDCKRRAASCSACLAPTGSRCVHACPLQVWTAPDRERPNQRGANRTPIRTPAECVRQQGYNSLLQVCTAPAYMWEASYGVLARDTLRPAKQQTVHTRMAGTVYVQAWCLLLSLTGFRNWHMRLPHPIYVATGLQQVPARHMCAAAFLLLASYLCFCLSTRCLAYPKGHAYSGHVSTFVGVSPRMIIVA